MERIVKVGKLTYDRDRLPDTERIELVALFRDPIEGDARIEEYRFAVYADDADRVTLSAKVDGV